MSRLRSTLTLALALAAGTAAFDSGPSASASAPSPHATLNCRYANCAEVADPEPVFGEDVYVGHDEPTNTFYSNVKGSGNNLRYQLKLPTDPSANAPSTPGKSYQFELNGSFWFGMSLCDTQSYPEQVSTCTPDSDKNILDPAVSPRHSGSAFAELQFYPPGWVQWPTFQKTIGAGSCDPTKWCAALNIFSLLRDPVSGLQQNNTCAAVVGIETVNFAFLTKSGKSQAPPSPLQSTVATFTPSAEPDLFMSSGDNLAVTMHDTEHGLQAVIDDKTTHQTGSITASAANGFAQVNYAPPPSTACTQTPYDFHPMYSTSSEQTRTIWAAHTTNIGFTSEIGHFQFCNGAPIPPTAFGASCPAGNTEETGASAEPTDGDENAASPTGPACFPPSRSGRVEIAGCTDQNDGFDGVDYQPVWPDGNTRLHPTSVLYSSPTTGKEYGVQYSRAAFEADLPRVEANTCNRVTGTGCTLIPTTDDGVPASFYPFFSTRKAGEGEATCGWQFGNHITGSANDFGRNAQYGVLLAPSYITVGGGHNNRFNDFRGIIANPCKSGGGGGGE